MIASRGRITAKLKEHEAMLQRSRTRVEGATLARTSEGESLVIDLQDAAPPLWYPREFAIIDVVSQSNKILCTPVDAASPYYLIDAPRQFGTRPRRGATSTELVDLPRNFRALGSRDADLTHVQASAIRRSTNIRVLKLEDDFTLFPEAYDWGAAQKTYRPLTQIWWPVYGGAGNAGPSNNGHGYLWAVPTGARRTVTPSTASGTADYLAHLQELTGGAPAITGWIDINREARRWVNHRDIVNDAAFRRPANATEAEELVYAYDEDPDSTDYTDLDAL